MFCPKSLLKCVAILQLVQNAEHCLLTSYMKHESLSKHYSMYYSFLSSNEPLTWKKKRPAQFLHSLGAVLPFSTNLKLTEWTWGGGGLQLKCFKQDSSEISQQEIGDGKSLHYILSCSVKVTELEIRIAIYKRLRWEKSSSLWNNLLFFGHVQVSQRTPLGLFFWSWGTPSVSFRAVFVCPRTCARPVLSKPLPYFCFSTHIKERKMYYLSSLVCPSCYSIVASSKHSLF